MTDTDTVTDTAPAGQLEYRAAEQIGVSFPDRTIELVVMPYETETFVPWQGRMITEVVTTGAFDGIERRANRIRVNRDHDVGKTCGRAVAVHSKPDGLYAELRIAQTPLGDETLALADEGILDASAGFLPFPGGEKWETRNRRRLNKCWLGHIAMVPDPAYETATVLAVRANEAAAVTTTGAGAAATPNLDRLALQRLEALYADIDRRYGLNR